MMLSNSMLSIDNMVISDNQMLSADKIMYLDNMLSYLYLENFTHSRWIDEFFLLILIWIRKFLWQRNLFQEFFLLLLFI
jgi:hypothetical protein